MTMPTIKDLRSTYATSLAFVSSRDELGRVLNARGLFGCGVEVGVQRGYFSEEILSRWQGSHLISIDPWLEDPTGEYVDIANVGQSQQDKLYQETCDRLARFGARSSVWRLTSVEASSLVPHHSLDFAYLDARHDYDSVLEDLEAWFDKIRPGGVIAGHDYIDGKFDAGIFGVKSAVDDFFAARGLTVYATEDDKPWLTWMVAIPTPGAAAAVEEVEEEPATPRVGVTLNFASAGKPREVKLALDPKHMSQRIMLNALQNNQMYEPETTALLTSVLRDGDTFVDVGTHVGFFSSIAAALVGDEGRVVSFEPEARNFGQLKDHIALNGFANITPVNAAVGAEETTAELWVNADNDGGHALWDVGHHAFNAKSRRVQNRREVAVTTLDRHFAAGESLPKLIKIDVEGSELRVLEGARGLLERRVPYVLCEINHFALKEMGATEDSLRAFMASHGYETNAINPETGEIITLAPDQRVVSTDVFNLLFRHTTAPLIGAAA